MTTAFLLALAAAAPLPTTGRFDLMCTGTRVEAVGPAGEVATPWTGRLSFDLGRGVVRRDEEPENLRLKPGPADRLVVEDEVKGFGDAVVRLEAHVDRATAAYSARASTQVGDFTLQDTTVTSSCVTAPFTRLAPKDAPEPIPERGPPR